MEKKIVDTMRKNTPRAEFDMGWGWLSTKAMNKLGVSQELLEDMFYEVTPSYNYNGYNIRWK